MRNAKMRLQVPFQLEPEHSVFHFAAAKVALILATVYLYLFSFDVAVPVAIYI